MKLIIIGAGIAGLSAGYFARKNGFDVEIYEKNSIVGGECIGWDREGYHIDGCIQWLTGTKEGTGINELWKEVGALEDTEIIQLDEFIRFNFGGEEIVFWKDLEKLKKELIKISPEDEEAIDDFINDIKSLMKITMPVDKPMDMMNVFEMMKIGMPMMSAGMNMSRLGKITVREYVDKFKSETIKKALYYQMANPDFSASSMIFSLATFASGNGAIPEGGSMKMSERIRDKYLDMGGSLYLNSSADEVIIKGGKAVGIKLSDGSIKNADYVISTADAHFTYHKLLKGNYNDKEFENRFNAPKDYPLISSMYIAYGIDADMSDIPVSVIFDCEKYVIAGVERECLGFRHYGYDKTLNKKGRNTGVCIINQTGEETKYWADLYEKDKKRYKEEKKRIGEELKDRLVEKYPQLEGKIKCIDVATPVTYMRYCNAYKGAWMGFMFTPKNNQMMQHMGEVENLKNFYLGGQWIQAPGGLPVALTMGKFAVMRICREENIKFN